jgi:4-diphosphocytidyl-2-C-methyl-D-erythritol kinase
VTPRQPAPGRSTPRQPAPGRSTPRQPAPDRSTPRQPAPRRRGRTGGGRAVSSAESPPSRPERAPGSAPNGAPERAPAGAPAGGATTPPAVEVEVAARAKINLYLTVGPRGPDGYHGIATVLQTVGLADTLVLRPAAGTGEAAVRFARGRGYAGPLPEPPDLVARALELAATELRGAVPTAAEVTKQIPMAAGLAGGSADAAAALLGADTLAGADTPRGQLEALCRRLGSDVAFCLRGGTAFGRGRGDRLSPLACRHGIWWVLGISEFPLATADVYRRFDERAGAGAPASGDPDARLGRPNRLADALAAGHPKAIAPLLHNDLEAPALDLAPPLAGRKQAMLAAGALNALVSGSGPTIAGICRDEAHAEEVAARAGGEFPRVEVVASTPVGAEILAREP